MERSQSPAPRAWDAGTGLLDGVCDPGRGWVIGASVWLGLQCKTLAQE